MLWIAQRFLWREKQQCQTLQSDQRRELKGSLGIWGPERVLLSGFSRVVRAKQARLQVGMTKWGVRKQKEWGDYSYRECVGKKRNETRVEAGTAWRNFTLGWADKYLFSLRRKDQVRYQEKIIITAKSQDRQCKIFQLFKDKREKRKNKCK